MARKARQRISYVLPLANSPGGHLLGVNSLAVDQDHGILYSAGRDGLICSWKLGVELSEKVPGTSRKSGVPSVLQTQVQAHTHWVNDIVLAKNNEYLVSCSSDLTVKLWRPWGSIDELPHTIGHHSDYAKVVVAPRDNSDWVASGGLDRKVKMWDLHGKGTILEIDNRDEDNPKGSVYALATGGNIIASGGPESVVRVWDPRSGKRVTKFVGHTDNIRAILVSEQGDHILTGSSDTTIKLWSLTGGRCLDTLTMHNDSVWSLFSCSPKLDVFYSSDRTGLVAKTDVRNVKDIDEGTCVAICQEGEGVRKVVAAGDYIWTTSSSSSIKRWADVEASADTAVNPSTTQPHSAGSTGARQKNLSGSPAATAPKNPPISPHSLLRLSEASPLFSGIRDPDAVTIYSVTSVRQPSISEAVLGAEAGMVVPVHEAPEEVIKGQHGLIKHFMLNDRRRVLTLDTAGEVMMWDLIKCVPIKSFGKKDLEDVAAGVNTVESVANWCQVDTRTGRLACVLEENHCFDAEMYADEVESSEPLQYREDQRINLGKWVLRYLFARLIDEEVRQDEIYRQKLQDQRKEREAFRRANAPAQITLPPQSWITDSPMPSGITASPRVFPQTPMTIGLATPAPFHIPSNTPSDQLSTSVEEAGSENSVGRSSLQATVRTSTDRQSSTNGDYFGTAAKSPTTINGASLGDHSQPPESTPTSPLVAEPQESSTKEGWIGKLRFGSKRDKRPVSTDGAKPATEERPQIIEAEPPVIIETYDDTVGGVVQRTRQQYDAQHSEHGNNNGDIKEEMLIKSKISPSLPSETPVLKPPGDTAIIIQEDRPDSGGVADLYRGTVSSVGEDMGLLEQVAPAWLGDVLLLNKIPFKETVKVSFVLQPWNNYLPSVSTAADGTLSRLNANRMLRAKKILSYVAERLPTSHFAEAPERGREAVKQEESLELLCHGHVVANNQTLATIRSHVWKQGGDVLLLYRKKNWDKQTEKRSEDGGKECNEAAFEAEKECETKKDQADCNSVSGKWEPSCD